MSLESESQPETPTNTTLVSRRTLLKMVAAAGAGTSAALFLPGQWSKPVAEVGVLPAHAQVSAGLYTFVSANAVGVTVTGGPVAVFYIEASCTIIPGDADIPILIKWQSLDGSQIFDTALASTIAGGTLTVDGAWYQDCGQIQVVFAFNNPAQGTDTISAGCSYPPFSSPGKN
jgi:hypothetical protein